MCTRIQDTSNTKCNDLVDKTVNSSSYRRVYDLYNDDKIQIINTDLQVRLCGKSCWVSTSYNNYIIVIYPARIVSPQVKC